MQDLRRNLSPVFYKMYTGQTEIIDEYGNHTGSWKPGYGELKAVKLSVSPNRGSAESEMFGTLDDYDRTMTTADTECEMCIRDRSVCCVLLEYSQMIHTKAGQ